MDIATLIASEFSLRPSLIYLNHAAVAPWPARTAAAIKAFAEENIEFGATHYQKWQAVEQHTRRQCADLVNAPSADDIALLKNTSEALSVIAHGFPWKAGDNVITSDEEFPSNHIVWDSLISRGVEVRKVKISGVRDPERSLIDAADANTRVLSISSLQYASGLRIELARLGEHCARRNIAFCVDAIQGLGVFPHDVQAMHIDFLAADAHKWLLGPEGIAVFYCRAKWREHLTLHQYGWHMLEALGNYDRPDWRIAQSARRFECGSQNMLGIHALSASVSLLLEVGIDKIEAAVMERSDRLFALIEQQPLLIPITENKPKRYGGIVTFRHRERTSATLHSHLQDHEVICAPRGGGIRFSPHFYTPLEQLDRAIAIAVG